MDNKSDEKNDVDDGADIEHDSQSSQLATQEKPL